MVEPTVEKLSKLEQQKLLPKRLRMDNAGENLKLKERCENKDWKLPLIYEFTARNTPQQNALAEVSLHILAGRARAMLYDASVPSDMRHLLFPEAVKTATLLDGLVPITLNGKTATRFEHKYGDNPKFASHLRTWGEAGTVTIKSNMQPKSKDRGVVCMFTGYAEDHAGDCFKRCDMATPHVL